MMTCHNNTKTDSNSSSVCDITYLPLDPSEDIKLAIKNNDPIEPKLNMVICVSNPCNYKRRYELAKEFIYRMNNNTDVNLVVVELSYKFPGKTPQSFKLTNSYNPNHLQIVTESAPIWAKENLLNLGVKLLPKDWKAVAFCDADIQFDNANFATDTLKILNGAKDIVHMHSHSLDLDPKLDPMTLFSSFGYQYMQHRKYSRKDIHFWHPGYNVAMTRKTYDKIGGLYQESILGSGDHNLFLSLIYNGIKSINKDTSPGYRKSILEFQNRCKGLRLGCVPGVIRHFFHGQKKNRQYVERWKILIKHQFDPYKHLVLEQNGLQVPSKNCPQELLEDIMMYFQQRNEDE